jgi:hypothetical protein
MRPAWWGNSHFDRLLMQTYPHPVERLDLGGH